jgi:hypothetical protein
MAVTKLSVSVEEEIAEVVKTAARDEGVTVSAWLTAAAAARIRNQLLGEAIAEAANDIDGYDAEAARGMASAARSKTIHVGRSAT